MSLTDQQDQQTVRRLRGRIGAHALHALRDPRSTTARARRVFLERFEREVDPDGVLDPQERQRRAAHARKAHFARLALRSAQRRRAKARRRNGGDADV